LLRAPRQIKYPPGPLAPPPPPPSPLPPKHYSS
jgi:hypothetical protein